MEKGWIPLASPWFGRIHSHGFCYRARHWEGGYIGIFRGSLKGFKTQPCPDAAHIYIYSSDPFLSLLQKALCRIFKLLLTFTNASSNHPILPKGVLDLSRQWNHLSISQFTKEMSCLASLPLSPLYPINNHVLLI